jgi:FMN-dependent NADH-azoreductase
MIVMATLMHNFSLPDTVKTYFDAIMKSDITFKYHVDKQIGLMDKSKFSTLYTRMGHITENTGLWII